MSATADILTGATLTAGTSSWSADLTGISPEFSREAVETTHLGTAAPGAGKFGNKTFIPARTSGGTCGVEGFYNPDTIPPTDAVTETWTIQYTASGGDSTGASLAFSGFMTNFAITGSLDEAITFTADLQISGNVTRTAGS